MAIALNGSTGVITGVSVGGLPNGIVDTDTLATDSVTAAKILSLPAGSILQVVSMRTSTQTTLSTSSWVDTAITLNITPSSSSSKVLILANAIGLIKRDQNTKGGLRLVRGSSTGLSSMDENWAYNNATQHNSVGGVGFTYLDSPSTTSATTYKVQAKNTNATGSVRVNWDGAASSSITLIEVAA